MHLVKCLQQFDTWCYISFSFIHGFVCLQVYSDFVGSQATTNPSSRASSSAISDSDISKSKTCYKKRIMEHSHISKKLKDLETSHSPNTCEFSRIREGLTDFGIVTNPFCRHHRMRICAVVLLCFSAICKSKLHLHQEWQLALLSSYKFYVIVKQFQAINASINIKTYSVYSH